MEEAVRMPKNTPSQKFFGRHIFSEKGRWTGSE
jgi:hypothetical protein